MGSGCSSPLRRIGGKRAKANRRQSLTIDDVDQQTTDRTKAAGETDQTYNQTGEPGDQQQSEIQHQHQQQQQQQRQQQQHKPFIIENEVTIHSETNEDHPSSASIGPDALHQPKLIQADNPRQSGLSGPSGSTTSATATARLTGFNGTYVPHDRHLLVSPALSPAPSTCHSPLTASSSLAFLTNTIALNDLDEVFKTITLGMPNQPNNRIKQPDRPQSELHNYYTQQLCQAKTDLVNFISVVLITTENFNCIKNQTQASETKQQQQLHYQYNYNDPFDIVNKIELSLKSFCDEHSFNLRFLNLSYECLSENFMVNNLIDVSMKIIEQEYQLNPQRLIFLILSNNPTAGANNDIENHNLLDKKQLPAMIESNIMNKYLNIQSDDFDNNLFRKTFELWYNQVGSHFYLNPIYTVQPKILSEQKEFRQEAWRCWSKDSNLIRTGINLIQTSNQDIANSIKLKYLSNNLIEFIMKESHLQKRALLIRNLSQPVNNVPPSMSDNQQLQQSATSSIGSSNFNKDSLVNDLAKILPDPNKLTLKRSITIEEIIKTVNDWIIENFNKFLEGIREDQITNGKHIPPFIDRNLFIELTCQRHKFEYFMDNISENYSDKCYKFYKNQIQPILNGSAIGNLNIAENNSLNENSLKGNDSKQISANHLVFITAPKGCGKSTLFAQMIRHVSQDYFNKAHIMYRFCGISRDSLDHNRLLRSICEQFCQTQGENIAAASYIYSSKIQIINALNKIIKLQNSIIFLDGIDKLSQSSNFSASLDWLCEIEANPHIKIFIIIETDSSLYKKALSTYTDATYITLDYPTTNEWANMLTTTARTKRLNSSGNLYDEIKNLNLSDTTKDLNITYKDVNDVINLCKIRQLNNEHTYPELKIMQGNQIIQNLKTVHQNILTHLHYLLSPFHLCALFVAIHSSRNGLIESDLINIMIMISQSTKFSSYTTNGNNNNELKFSSTIFSYFKIQFQAYLIYIICDKVVKINIDKEFLTSAIDYYTSKFYPNLVTEIREILLEYFSHNQITTKSSSSIISAIKGGDHIVSNEPKDNVSQAEALRLATQLSETMNLLISINPAKAKEYIMTKNNFFMLFLYNNMPEEFIEDFDRLKLFNGSRKPSYNEELQCLVDYIRLSVYPLRYDGSQIYSQIFCRSFEILKSGKIPKGKKFNDIIATAACPPIVNLMPISETSINSFIKTRIGLPMNKRDSYSDNSNQQSGIKLTKNQLYGSSTYDNQQLITGHTQSKQKIYNIRDNHRHVIVIYPDKGILSVWDIYEERAVRTISNLDQPRNIKMIDQKRAVVLCNRELRVYDLDSGVMLTKLKGVMNQKMPYFEIFGENYVIALARNRMYVNMLNLNTGELETTFKVGEDRFLNSLLVSANGGICVCGDETQKPFPLLVWNLNERRLMYDLRLDRHEFITRMSAISDDGHFVVSICRQLGDNELGAGGSNGGNSSQKQMGSHKSSPNFIIVYDLNSGTLFKKWKPGLNTCAVAISLPQNKTGKVINAIVDNTILIWDLSTGSKRHTLVGHSAPADVIKVQNSRLFSMDSSCRDQSLRVWDIEEGYCLAVFSPDAPVNCCEISTRGDALVCGFAADSRLSTLVMCKNESVNDVVKRNKRRKSSKSLYIFDESSSRKSSS